MKKKLYVLSVIFLSMCAVAIIVCCAVFSQLQDFNLPEDNQSSNSPHISDDLEFQYKSSLSVCLGDIGNLSPNVLQNEDLYSLSYFSNDPSVISVSKNGDFLASKCGSAEIQIKNHNVVIKKLDVLVNYKYDLQMISNCQVYGNKIYVNDKTAMFSLKLLNSNNNSQLMEIIPAIFSSERISVFPKMNCFLLTATCSGLLTFVFPNHNIKLTIEIEYKQQNTSALGVFCLYSLNNFNKHINYNLQNFYI